jgi:hypothetical protein
VASCVAYRVGSLVEEVLIVFNSYSRNVQKSLLLVLLISIGACVDPQAQKVQCDSKLRPINASNVEKSASSAAPESHRP